MRLWFKYRMLEILQFLDTVVFRYYLLFSYCMMWWHADDCAFYRAV